MRILAKQVSAQQLATYLAWPWTCLHVAVGIVPECVFTALPATFCAVCYLEHSVVYIYTVCSMGVTENSVAC